MRWEIEHKITPEPGEIRFITRFAWLPTVVLSKLTMTDHRIWLELYIEEQEYIRSVHNGEIVSEWFTVSKTIHV
jgi:hypothetical protein